MKGKNYWLGSRRNQVVALACLSVMAMVPLSASAAVLISDTFNRTGNLNGSSPDQPQVPGQTWTSDGADTTDGSVLQAGTNYTGGELPATLGSDVYSLSADITASDSTDATNWVALGFSPTSNATGNPFLNGSGGPWVLFRANGGFTAFSGPSYTNQTPGNGSVAFVNVDSDPSLAGVSANFKFVLDTTGTTTSGFDTVSLYVNGVQQGPTYTYSASNPNPTITGLGFGTTAASGTFDNVTLSTAVPEPASLSVLAIAGAGVLGRRRRRA